jgi:hypothetical protein
MAFLMYSVIWVGFICNLLGNRLLGTSGSPNLRGPTKREESETLLPERANDFREPLR